MASDSDPDEPVNSGALAESFNELLARRTGRPCKGTAPRPRAVDLELELLRKESKVTGVDASHVLRLSSIIGGNSRAKEIQPRPGRRAPVQASKPPASKAAMSSSQPQLHSGTGCEEAPLLPNSEHGQPSSPPPGLMLPPTLSQPPLLSSYHSGVHNDVLPLGPRDDAIGIGPSRMDQIRANINACPNITPEHSNGCVSSEEPEEARQSLLPLETQAANEIDPADGKEKLKQLCSANEAGAGLDFMKDFFEFERSHELRKVAERRRVVELLNSAFRQDLEDLISIHLEIATQGLSSSRLQSLPLSSRAESRTYAMDEESFPQAVSPPSTNAEIGCPQSDFDGRSPLEIDRELCGRKAAAALYSRSAVATISQSIDRLGTRLEQVEGVLVQELSRMRSIVEVQADESRRLAQLLHASFSLGLSLQEQQARTATALSTLAVLVAPKQRDVQSTAPHAGPNHTTPCGDAFGHAIGGKLDVQDDGSRSTAALLKVMQQEQRQLSKEILEMTERVLRRQPRPRLGRRNVAGSTRASAVRANTRRRGRATEWSCSSTDFGSRSHEKSLGSAHSKGVHTDFTEPSHREVAQAHLPTSSAETCVVCYERPAAAVFYRCGHQCACNQCAFYIHSQQQPCPICRWPIDDVIRIFPC